MTPKKQDSFKTYIKCVRLFRDDIDYIISRCHSQSIEIEISDGENIYDDLDELIKFKGKNPKYLQLIGYLDGSSYSNLQITTFLYQVRLSIWSSEKLYPFGYELKDYFIKKKSLFTRASNAWIWLSILWVIILSKLLIPSVNAYINSSMWLILIYALIIIIATITMSMRLFYFRVNLVRKHESGFFKRNSDNIILSVISAVIGAVITLLVTSLINKP